MPDQATEAAVLTAPGDLKSGLLSYDGPLNTLVGGLVTPQMAQRIAVKAAIFQTEKSAIIRAALIEYWQRHFDEDLLGYYEH